MLNVSDLGLHNKYKATSLDLGQPECDVFVSCVSDFHFHPEEEQNGVMNTSRQLLGFMIREPAAWKFS